MANFPQLDRRAAIALAALGLLGCTQASGADEDVVPLRTAFQAHQAGTAVLIDVREPHEHAQGVAPNAVLLPKSQLEQRLSLVPVDPAKPVYLICATQNRSRATLKSLRERGGYAHVRYVQGGMTEWKQQGLPIVRP